jgi:transposase
MGTLQADGYAGYDAVHEGGRVNEAACMAHVRRPFYDLYETHKSAVAKEALERALYVIEEEIRGRSAEERREVRNERSRPSLESLKQWFEETLGSAIVECWR